MSSIYYYQIISFLQITVEKSHYEWQYWKYSVKVTAIFQAKRRNVRKLKNEGITEIF